MYVGKYTEIYFLKYLYFKESSLPYKVDQYNHGKTI